MPVQDLQLPDLTLLTVQGRHATYAIEPLEPGYGATSPSMAPLPTIATFPRFACSD
ncbi:MAG TPA: hypothetical protein VKR06_46740 [Ktedonosporobacter sp.]|nr:hypothetical protein [Ktedonosporobacter sp.]